LQETYKLKQNTARRKLDLAALAERETLIGEYSLLIKSTGPGRSQIGPGPVAAKSIIAQEKESKMSKVYVGDQLVTSPDQFNKLIGEALRRRPVEVSRTIAISVMVRKLSVYSAMWRKEWPLLDLDQEVNLRLVLLDVCGMLGLSDEERIFIVGKQLRLPEIK
jgi:hypothetical protein